jgi:hypothetical protein
MKKPHFGKTHHNVEPSTLDYSAVFRRLKKEELQFPGRAPLAINLTF